MLVGKLYMFIVILLSSVNSVISHDWERRCVIPTKQSFCNCSVPCHTLDFYISNPNSELYQLDYLTLEFLPGVHETTKTLSTRNRTGLHMIGSNATIDLIYSDNSSWFMLNQSSQILFSDLNIQLRHIENATECSLNYIFYFNDVELSLTNVILENHCGGGIYLTNTSSSVSIQFYNVTFFVWAIGLDMYNVKSIVEISYCLFMGSGRHLLLESHYDNIIGGSQTKIELNIQHSEFYNGSGSLNFYVDMLQQSPQSLASEMSLNLYCVNITTPNGGDINVMVLSDWDVSDTMSFNVSIEKVQLFSAKTYGIFLELGTYWGKYDVKIDDCSLSFHKECAVRIYSGNHKDSRISLANSVISYNKASPFNYPVSGLVIKGSREIDLNPNVILKNVTFESNRFLQTAIVDTVVTAMLFFVHRLTIIDCYFQNNIGTALYLENSTISAYGNVSFTNNTASNGAAIYINGPSVIFMNMSTNMIFTNNTSTQNGGAIYINSVVVHQLLYTLFNGPPMASPCFLYVDGNYKCNSNNKKQSCILQFQNNTAEDGGDAVYGGNLGQIVCPTSMHNVKCLTALNEMSQSSLSPSTIASAPSRVCLCFNSSHLADCLKINTSVSIYPGQIFNISAFTVGQNFGTSRGSVYAQILNKSSSVSISNEHKIQTVDIRNCNDSTNILMYRITTSLPEETATLVLTTEDVEVSNYVNKSEINDSIKEYNNANRTYVPIQLLTLPVYITLHFSKCPNGFTFVEGRCTCNPLFIHSTERYSVSCDIDTQTIERENSVWIDSSKATTKYSVKCPLTYCNQDKVSVNLSREHGVDSQCIHHHSGVLCGGCMKNYSLAIGSSNCLPHCSDDYLSLLLVFAVAGVLLVLFIKYLDLTITQGVMNGFIFYANIVQTNKDTLLFSDNSAVRVFATFIAWLNLDFGIETCFSQSLDVYTKTWLQFVFPLYLWVLVGGIILACRYSQIITRFFGNNAVQVLATIFLLSYNKLLRVITTVCSSSTIDVQSTDSGNIWQDTVWSYDGNISYFGSQHIYLIVASTVVFLFLWLPFTLCILLGPWLQRYSQYRGLKWVERIRPLLDAYYGPLKDRHRYWIGVLLLARVVVIIPAADPLTTSNANMLTIIILCLLLLLLMIGQGGVYKQLFLTLLESVLFSNLALFAALAIYSDNDNNNISNAAVYIMIGMVITGFLVYIGNQIVQIIILRRRRCYLRDYVSLDVQKPSPVEDDER